MDYIEREQHRHKHAFDALVGRTVTGWSLYDSERTLIAHCEEGDLSWSVKGDCCSDAWWAHACNLCLVSKPKRVRSVDVVDWLDVAPLPVNYEDESCRAQGDDQAAFVRVEFEYAGTTTFEIRQSSNGYYGGTLNPAEPWPYDGADPSKARRITEDF